MKKQKIDLTVIYYTANCPKRSFAERIRERLLLSIGELPLVSVSHKPLKFGKNICIGKREKSSLTVYRQILIGAKAAKTKYVALAEDDTLYPPTHFELRPSSDDVFAYNLNKWTIFSWLKPSFFMMNRRSTNSSMIAPRKLLIEAIKERLDRIDNNSKRFRLNNLRWMGEPGRQKYERNLGVTIRKAMAVYTVSPVVTFYHPKGLSYRALGKRKRRGKVRAMEIPFWGRAEEVIKKYYAR